MGQYGQRKYGTFRYGTDIPSTGQPQELTDAPLWRKPNPLRKPKPLPRKKKD